VRVEPLRNSEKKITGTIGIVLDITDRKQTMAELQARAQQQAAVAELGQRALAGLDGEALLGEVVRLVTAALDVESARVLGSERERKFTRDDLNFLQAVANILATTIGRKQAEEARARLVAILEATTDFVAIAGVDHRVLYLNRAGRALTGLPASDDATRHTLL